MRARSWRSWVLAWACLCAAVTATRVAYAAEESLSAQHWQAIRAVIEAQLLALRAGQDERAFGHASPAIRAQFGSPAAFMAMVRSSYAPLLHARYDEFLEGAVIEGRVIQPLRLVLPDNSVNVALYTMERQPDGAWRIAGCLIAPSRVQAV